jgi:hypothetical protein
MVRDIKLYIITDSNEIKAIVEGGAQFDLVKKYNFSADVICVNGQNHSITNLPMSTGEYVRKDSQLRFNPMSVIDEINSDERDILANKLVGGGLEVCAVNGTEVIHYFPNKHQGYQGGGLFNR